MKQFVTILFFFTCCITYGNAQTFLDKVKTVERDSGQVTVTQDISIDELVNGTKTTPRQKSKAKKDSTKVKKEIIKTAPEGPETATKEEIVTTGRKHMVAGFRVQAYAGNNSRASRQKAKSIGEHLKSEFPGQSVYVHFYSPRWICRIGNFTSRSEAEAMLQKVKDLGYSRACLVKGKISVY